MRTKKEIFDGEDENIVLLKCSLDFGFFCQRVLGYQMKPFHMEWCTLLRKNRRIAIMAPTGYGKTWIFGIGYPLWLSYFFPKSKSLIVSKTVKGQSSTVIESIKFLIEQNELLKELIPNDKRLSSWTKEQMICSNNSKIFNAPYSPSVRGNHVDYVFGDEVASYPDRSDNYVIWFRDVISRVADSKIKKIAAVSTPIDPADLITVLCRKEKEWVSTIYPAIVTKEGNAAVAPYKDGISIWPERFPMENLMEELNTQGAENFERNYQCNPDAQIAGAIFKTKNISAGWDTNRTFSDSSEGGLVIIGADFAMSEDVRADETAFVVVEKVAEKIIVKYMESGRGWSVDACIQKLINLHEIYQPYQIHLDKSNVGDHITNKLLLNGIPAIAQPFGAMSRNKLLSVLKVIISNEKLITPYSPEDLNAQQYTDKLTFQLNGFRQEKSKLSDMPVIRSKADHDDLAMALALAVRGAQEQDTGLEGFGGSEDENFNSLSRRGNFLTPPDQGVNRFVKDLNKIREENKNR
jgi:hypothetical protein